MFLVAVLAIAATPGPAVVLLLRRSAIGGFPVGARIVFGLETGIYLWILAAAGGLTAVVAASATAQAVLRVGGGCFLAYLGLQAWRSALGRRDGSHGSCAEVEVEPESAGGARSLGCGRRGGYAIGLATNLANPKAAVFAFAFYPQFIPHGYPFFATAALLGLLQISLETALYLGFSLAVSRARTWFSRTMVRRRLDALSGTVLLALGVRLAVRSR